ncbi:probable endonuclease III (DNA-(apurinic orapyrimidinic site) lyase) [Sulfurihydrogenibium azorense Az-Fu1]|uniref:Endonuclease III n=1 Tax=Sulfurihydrogenibium azorense (strain DSM 15241 / OCM 825 / Az-Fu1) TaxID=204536 RepID=C1DU03_SULAA|nr:endonuclease III [Sulfurihydrogenibium azorense]ACN99069.1 probable endonuclease III (DNA-(apurinic orapyrimidinic site) lyase) [Sulfurihydrogenibium azorense Az-Fu1]
MDGKTFVEVLKILKKESKNWNAPVVAFMGRTENNPYKVLIATILSLRTKDQITALASDRLFKVADTPEKMVNLPAEEIEKLIYPVGFYKNKAKTIKEISKIILEKYAGKVPDNLEDLLSLKGVGRKTANLVLSEGYKKPAICVDVHVHRISNRLGVVKTKTPEETEFKLMEILPKKYWRDVNWVLVAFGQTICKPIKPMCDICPVKNFCEFGKIKA